MSQRTATVERKTKETKIQLKLNLDGTGNSDVRSGIGFLDHLLTSLARHARFDLHLSCDGDLIVDDHHSTEDIALVLGSAFDRALGQPRQGIRRFGWAMAPLDEALARAVVDLSGRPYSAVDLGLEREQIGSLAAENIPHFVQSMAVTGRMTTHLDILKGENDHHRAEAAFKALALALAQAVKPTESQDVPSTKGVL